MQQNNESNNRGNGQQSESNSNAQNNSRTNQQPDNNSGNTVKDPDEWTTGKEPMTGAQHSYLKTLSDEAHEEFEENLTKADASKRIEELQQKTGRGLEDNDETVSNNP